jgi:4-amino-4-deoxy-L-arabinose transferase-like glycosyltransferase
MPINCEEDDEEKFKHNLSQKKEKMRLKFFSIFMNSIANIMRRSSTGRHYYAVIIGLALFSILLRITLLWSLGWAERPLVDDEGKYHEMALSIASGQGFQLEGKPTSWSGPGFPAYLASWYVLFGSKPNVGRSANTLLAGVLTVLVCFVGSRIFSREIGLVAGAITAVYPSLVYWNLFMLTEILYACGLLAIALVFSFLYERPYVNRAILAGFFIGLVSYIRPIGLIMIPLIILWILIFLNTPFLKRILLTVVIFVSLILVLAPWTIRNYRVHHRFVPITTNGGVNLLQGNNPVSWAPENELRGNLTFYLSESMKPYFREEYLNLSEVELSEKAMAITRQFLKDHITEAPIMAFYKVKQLFKIFPHGVSILEKLGLAVSYGVLLPFIIVGLVVAAFRNKRSWILFIFLLATMLGSIIFYGCPRLRLPVEPIMIIFGCYGLAWCKSKCRFF